MRVKVPPQRQVQIVGVYGKYFAEYQQASKHLFFDDDLYHDSEKSAKILTMATLVSFRDGLNQNVYTLDDALNIWTSHKDAALGIAEYYSEHNTKRAEEFKNLIEDIRILIKKLMEAEDVARS